MVTAGGWGGATLLSPREEAWHSSCPLICFLVTAQQLDLICMGLRPGYMEQAEGRGTIGDSGDWSSLERLLVEFGLGLGPT